MKEISKGLAIRIFKKEHPEFIVLRNRDIEKRRAKRMKALAERRLFLHREVLLCSEQGKTIDQIAKIYKIKRSYVEYLLYK